MVYLLKIYRSNFKMEEYKNKKLNFVNDIKYAEGAIVSKTLYRTETSVLTLFALAKEQKIAEHTTPFDALVQILEGEAEITIGDKVAVYKAGESIIMPINIPHALSAITDYKMLLTMMK